MYDYQFNTASTVNFKSTFLVRHVLLKTTKNKSEYGV